MNVAGIDVSKGKSTVAVVSSNGEIIKPFEITHDRKSLLNLAKILNSLQGETRVVMESTGRYHTVVADTLSECKLFVSVLNSLLIAKFDNNRIRKVKTDRLDAIKIANYGLFHWNDLQQYQTEEELRTSLKDTTRSREGLIKVQTALNNQLISLTDAYFPHVNNLFSPDPKEDGSVKWIDFIIRFRCANHIAKLGKSEFTKQYKTFCKKAGYKFSEKKASEVFSLASSHNLFQVKNEAALQTIEILAKQLQEINKAVVQLSEIANQIAQQLPEYEIVMNMCGIGKRLGPQLIAEIGNVIRFHSKKALVAFAGIDPPPFQSGQFEAKKRKISKRGAPELRRILHLIMRTLYIRQPTGNDILEFMEKKRSEGKHFYSVLMAGSNKFLRQYYAKVKKSLAPC